MHTHSHTCTHIAHTHTHTHNTLSIREATLSIARHRRNSTRRRDFANGVVIEVRHQQPPVLVHRHTERMRKTRCHPETIRKARLYDRKMDLFSGKRKKEKEEKKRKEKKRRDATPRPSEKSAGRSKMRFAVWKEQEKISRLPPRGHPQSSLVWCARACLCLQSPHSLTHTYSPLSAHPHSYVSSKVYPPAKRVFSFFLFPSVFQSHSLFVNSLSCELCICISFFLFSFSRSIRSQSVCVHLSVTGNGRDHPCARNFADGVVVAIGDQEIGIFVNCPHTHAQNKRTHTND